MHYHVGISLLLYDVVSRSSGASFRVFELISYLCRINGMENLGVVRGQREGKNKGWRD